MNEDERMGAVTGGCRCGRYRFASTAAPFWVSYCHCVDCRRATGAPVTAFAGFYDDQLTLQGEPAAVYRAGVHVERSFCAHCGAPLGYRDDRLADEHYYYIGTLDAPERFAPRLHSWTSERLAWLEIADDLPRHPGFGRAR